MVFWSQKYVLSFRITMNCNLGKKYTSFNNSYKSTNTWYLAMVHVSIVITKNITKIKYEVVCIKH